MKSIATPLQLLLGLCFWLLILLPAHAQDTTRTVFGPGNYPKEALRDSLEGEVVLEVRLDINGKYRGHRVLKSDHPVLLGYVIQEVLPTLAFPKPKPFGSRLVIVPFEFRLNQPKPAWEE